jgi:hypothetical protein
LLEVVEPGRARREWKETAERHRRWWTPRIK